MAAVISTEGLQNLDAAVTTLADVQWAAATGSANAIAAAFPTAIAALPDGLIVGVRASAANTTATPTFSPDSLTARTITKAGGLALVPGDINGAGHEILLRYRLSVTQWELLNPHTSKLATVSWAAAAGTVDALTAAFVPPHLAFQDGEIVSVRASGANATTTPTLAGDGLTARTITRQGNQALSIGDIYGAGHELLLRYVTATPRWELLNPSIAYRATAIDGILFKSVSGIAGLDVITAQPFLPAAGGVTVKIGTYRLKAYLRLSRAAGANAHTTGVLFAGGATYTISGDLRCKTGDAADLQPMSAIPFAVATETVVKAASTSTTEQTVIEVEGIVIVTVAGTFIPQFKFSAAPGNGTTGIPTVSAWIELMPFTNPLGTWA